MRGSLLPRYNRIYHHVYHHIMSMTAVSTLFYALGYLTAVGAFEGVPHTVAGLAAS